MYCSSHRESSSLRQAGWLPVVVAIAIGSFWASGLGGQEPLYNYAPGAHPLNSWIKRSPLPGAPPSPRLGYEGACVWDTKHQLMIRYGGHNQGGGGEQGSEIWTFNPVTAHWKLHEPNTSPPGICCGQQNLYDPIRGWYLRFPAFSASHGWQWHREVWLNDASVWRYELESNTWKNLRPYPTAHPRPLRCAAWDTHHQVVVMFGGEGSSEGTQVYDPRSNTWTAMHPPEQPAFRSGGNMAYDQRHRVFVLFGAQFTNDPHTWLYDLRTNRWRDAQPAVMPPTDRNDAVLTYDAVSGKVVAIVKVPAADEDSAGRLETWVYSVTDNNWSRLDAKPEPDFSGNRARQLMYASSLNVVLLENRTHPPTGPAEQQIWTLRLADPPRVPADAEAHVAAQLTTTENTVLLSWEPASAHIQRYRILRGQADKPWQAQMVELASVPASQTQYEDTTVQRGRIYFYRIVAMDMQGATRAESHLLRTQPNLITELVVSVVDPQQVAVTWQPPHPADDVVGYVVERAVVEVWSDDQLLRLKKRTPPLQLPSVGAIRRVGTFVPVSSAPVPQTSFIDRTIDLNTPAQIEGEPVEEIRWHEENLDRAGTAYPYAVYAYRVRAVNRLGVAGGPSPAVFTIPSAPQWVFSREENGKCHLKWAPNPESSIVGYRIYRMDGRFDSAPIRRLTEKPVQATTFIDEQAGDVTRRYYIVAVDGLGQEGHPSAPVWYLREWRSFYEPFVGAWHQ
ncbi:MAG: hypothetical protein KatS3mg110_0322 [Pirellulaceae bacterium]|nr:MAG: hypothetical protein KatS3mg110_0322 [Pirellulaceae bacterium]